MEKGYYHYLIRDGNISNTFNPIKGRDIFWGFASRYEFLKNAENNIEERIYNIVFEKACKNGIQAIHGLSLIRDFEEIKKVTSYVLLKMNGKYKNLKSERIELIIANKCTRMYAYIICFFYKYIRGK